MIGIGLGLTKRRGGGGVILDPDLQTYLDALSTPLSSDQQTKLSTLITDVKDGLNINNLSDFFDTFYMLANETEDAALKNMVKRSHDGIAYNSPVFTQYEGFKGDGSNAYLKMDYNPSTDAVNYTQNESSYGLLTLSGGINPASYGPQYGIAAYGLGYYSIDKIRHYHNDNTRKDINNTNNNTNYIFSSNNLTNVSVWNNGLLTSYVGDNDNLPSSQVTLLRVGAYYALDTISFYMSGAKKLSSTSEGVIRNAIETYMDSNGKGILT